MSNELIFILTVLIYLGSVLVLYKVFGKNGLYAFAVFGSSERTVFMRSRSSELCSAI